MALFTSAQRVFRSLVIAILMSFLLLKYFDYFDLRTNGTAKIVQQKDTNDISSSDTSQYTRDDPECLNYTTVERSYSIEPTLSDSSVHSENVNSKDQDDSTDRVIYETGQNRNGSDDDPLKTADQDNQLEADLEVFQRQEDTSTENVKASLSDKSSGTNQNVTSVPRRRNILLVIVDDLRAEIKSFVDEKKRPWLNPNIHTPNLDELASHSAVFTQAYVQAACCNPSRSSFLTGRRPDSIGITDNVGWFRKNGNPNIVTLPQYFMQQNFTTDGLGKIFHLQPGYAQDPISWSSFTQLKMMETGGIWRSVPDAVLGKNPLTDQILTQDAINKLELKTENYVKRGQNFFMAVGYKRPHIPWICPESFMELYPLDQIALPPNPLAPSKMPYQAWLSRIDVKELLNVSGAWPINATLSANITKILRRAYYGCVSYIDHEIGLLMEKVKELGLLNSTVIAFLGDHGYHLGEHGLWAKRTNFEEATHAPFMLRIPGKTEQGIKIPDLVEFLDLFPTLVELAGLPALPKCGKNNSIYTDACVEGSSLVPLLTGGLGKDAVYSQFPCQYKHCSRTMGYSVRTDRYRYTEWWKANDTLGKSPEAQQLFDLMEDPLENYNIADDPKFTTVKTMMASKLRLI